MSDLLHLGGPRAIEGVGLNDVRARLEVGGVDGLYHIGPCDDQQVIVSLQLMRVVLVPGAQSGGTRNRTA